MNDAITIALVLALLGMLLVVVALPISTVLVRLSARRLPAALALRMEEEWLGELNSINSRPGKLAFAAALILTPRQAFVAPGEEAMSETVTVLSSRKSLVLLSTLTFAIVAYGASYLVPVKYESEAVLISEGRNDLLRKEMTSRSFLTRVIQFLKWKEDMVDDLRRNVTVTAESLGEGQNAGFSFVVKYLGPDPVSTQKVTSALASHLIEQNFQFRVDQSEATRDFLETRLRVLRADLEKQGDDVARRPAGVTGALDHELLLSSYKTLFAKYQDAQMSVSQQQSQLRILDAPQLGSEVAPNRAGFAGIGALAGLVMGAMAVFGLNRRQRKVLASK